jgi:antitoxin MazE
MAYILRLAMRVSKWGNSLAVRLPNTVVKALELHEGDEIELHAVSYRDFDVVRRPTQRELVEQLRKYRGLLPADFKFDREEANAR